MHPGLGRFFVRRCGNLIAISDGIERNYTPDSYSARAEIAPMHAYLRLNTTYAIHAQKWSYADRDCTHDDWFCGLRQRGYGGTDIYPEIHADKHICTCTHIRVIASPNIYVHSFCVCRQGDTSHIHKHRQVHACGRTTTYAQRNISRVMYASCFFSDT